MKFFLTQKYTLLKFDTFLTSWFEQTKSVKVSIKFVCCADKSGKSNLIISKKLIDITENKPKLNKPNLKSYISKQKVNKEIYPLVVIETGSFIIQL